MDAQETAKGDESRPCRWARLRNHRIIDEQKHNMNSRIHISRLLPVSAGLVLAVCASAATHPQAGEITVSSANYANTPFRSLVSAQKAPDSVNPPNLGEVKKLPAPQYYLFSIGEYYPSDVAPPDVLRILQKPLADKGYLHAGVEKRAGRNPDNRIDLVLRVHCGERTWRDPQVRVVDLAWDDGLVQKRPFETMVSGGTVSVWDAHAGGDDLALADIERALDAATHRSSGNEPSSFMPGLNNPSNPFGGLRDELTSGLSTRDFYLVAIEAFRFDDLQKLRGDAKRVWTTFIAIPKSDGQKFADVLPRMARLATNYFGETTQGMVVFDQNARVEVGAPYEVRDTLDVFDTANPARVP
jgi:hypothetical protein